MLVGTASTDAQKGDGLCQQQSFLPGLQPHVVSERPRIYHYPDFLSVAECDAIRALGMPRLTPSVVDDAGGVENQQIRSSSSHFFSVEEQTSSPEIMAVKRRAAAITHINLEYQEALQIQHYQAPRMEGRRQRQDFYIPHYDWKPSSMPQRVATLIIYIEEPEHGGETIFPLVRHNSSARPLHTPDEAEHFTRAQWAEGVCTAAEAPWLRVHPRKGTAVLFYTLLPDSKLDPLSIHGSCPVIAGAKTVLQVWFSSEWSAPVFSPGLEALWRSPGFGAADVQGREGDRDVSGHKAALLPAAALRAGPLSQGEGARVPAAAAHVRGADGAGGVELCSERGLMSESAASRQFSVAFMVAVGSCAAHTRVRVVVPEAAAPAGSGGAPSVQGHGDAVWELTLEECAFRLSVPGASGDARARARPRIAPKQWVHVTVVTQDLMAPPAAPGPAPAAAQGQLAMAPSAHARWRYRTHLVVEGVRGAVSVDGETAAGLLDWEASRVCLHNARPSAADFAEVYVFSRQLAAAEIKKLRWISSQVCVRACRVRAACVCVCHVHHGYVSCHVDRSETRHVVVPRPICFHPRSHMDVGETDKASSNPCQDRSQE